MKTTYYPFLVLVFAALSALASVATTKEITRNTPTFNFTPPETPQPGSANMVVALVKPRFEGESTGERYDFEPFQSFKSNLESDILESLTAKGFTVRGPFKNRDEMVYSDKENSELLFVVNVSPKFNKVSGSWVPFKAFNGTTSETYYKFKGEIELYGLISIDAIEPISGEKMWAKSLDIVSERKVVAVNSTKGVASAWYNTDAGFALLIKEDAAVANSVTEVLQNSYESIMRKMWNHLDPKEFQLMRPRIKTLKEKY